MEQAVTSEEQAELAARQVASEVAAVRVHPIIWGSERVRIAEDAVQRRIIAGILPGGLVEYWQMVEQEVRR